MCDLKATQKYLREPIALPKYLYGPFRPHISLQSPFLHLQISVISDFRLTSDLSPPRDKNLEYEINTKKTLNLCR